LGAVTPEPRRRRRPSWRDGVIALAVLALSLAHARGLNGLGIALTVALVVPLLWRHQAPVIVFALLWAVAAVQWLAVGPVFADSALLIAFYTIATSCDLRTTAIAGAALELGVVLAAVQFSNGLDPGLKSFVGLSGLATAAGVVGINLRQTLAGLQERADRL
jgi:hypothetical protein